MNNNSNDDFMTWFESLSDEQQESALAAAKDYAALLGVTVPATEEEQEEARIDAIAGELLEGVRI